MKISETVDIARAGSFPRSRLWKRAVQDVEAAIAVADWPFGSGTLSLNPTFRRTRRGKEDRHPNGVIPIKVPLRAHLESCGWVAESLPAMPAAQLLRTGDLDALLVVRGYSIGFEWETGNVSSSHRAINKLLDGISRRTLSGGFLALPVRSMQRHLTDRVGNYEELAPYFQFWGHYPISNGILRIYGVEHDKLDKNVPHIPKGTAGRALR